MKGRHHGGYFSDDNGGLSLWARAADHAKGLPPTLTLRIPFAEPVGVDEARELVESLHAGEFDHLLKGDGQ